MGGIVRNGVELRAEHKRQELHELEEKAREDLTGERTGGRAIGTGTGTNPNGVSEDLIDFSCD